jgi:segregation and condensation protein B
LDALTPHIESLIFAADRAVSVEDIHECLEATFESLIPVQDIMMSIESLAQRYQHHDYSFELIEIAGGWQFMTKPAFHASVHTYLRQNANKRLSAAAMETLAIIAYKQPVTKPELEAIRGVSCDYSIQKLLEKELVAIVGRSEAVGKPLLYGTSEKFMDYFGLKSMKDLPKLRDFKLPEEEIGQSPPIEEMVDNLKVGRRAVAEIEVGPGIQLEPTAPMLVNYNNESE